jgi:hypothetical protein
MGNKVPVAVAGVIVVVLVGIFVFVSTEGEAGPSSGQATGPAPTTQFPRSSPDPSGSEPAPDKPRPVPFEQVDSDLRIVALMAGRTLYIPVQHGDCIREGVWPRGEHADQVEVEIRPLPAPPSPGVTTGADEIDYCMEWASMGDTYAVIELAEPLGDRRLVVERVFDAPPS